VMVKGSNFSMSSGDEAGNAGGGVVSSKFKGKAEFLNYSFDVKFEGKAVARLADPLGNNCGSTFNGPCPAEGQSPLVVTDAQKAEQKEACERLKKKGVPKEDRAEVASEKYGMLPEHAEAMSQACQETGMSATLRKTNPDCLGKIAEGFATKPKGGGGSSISDVANLPDECKGLVGMKDGAGGFSGVYSTGGVIPAADITAARDSMGGPKFNEWMKSKGAQTGDYDVHDIFDSAGNRAKNGSIEELTFNGYANDAIGRTDVDTRMVQHGPQANFREYIDAHPGYEDELVEKFGDGDIDAGKKKLEGVLKPDVRPPDPKPMLHFDSNGEMYEIETEDELKDLYKCKGEEYPEHWK